MSAERDDNDDEVIRLCNEILGLMRQACGRELNADGTEWCARRHGHDGACRGVRVTL